jgi:iron complex outermembrane receptor protein
MPRQDAANKGNDMPRKTLLQTTAYWLAGAIALSPALVRAAEAETGVSEEILVTARKRSEDIQTVPLSIVALTQRDLVARNIANFADLGNATPGVAITSIAGGTVQSIYLRGLAPANTANDLNVEANVGVFIDGIYQTSRNTLDFISVLDVGQIEIAKGPQSALYGRSTFAGALSIATNRPSDTLEGSASLTVGEDNDFRARATVAGPITDKISARVAGGFLSYGGFGKNIAATNDKLGGTKKYAFSGAVEFRPTENLTARVQGFYTHSETEMTPVTVLPINQFNCGNKSTAAVTLGLSQLYCGDLAPSRLSDISPATPDTVAETYQVSADLTWDLGFARLISVTGWTHATNRAFNDYDGTSAGVLLGVCTTGAACVGVPSYSRLTRANLISTSAERVATFSQEFRLQSEDNSDLSWLLGVNYFNSRVPLAAGGVGTDRAGLGANDRFVAVTQIASPPSSGVGAYEFTANPFTVDDSNQTQLFSSYSNSYTRTKSVFGALGYRFGTVRVNAEGRYNIDDKRAQVFSVSNPLSQPGINLPINGTTSPADGFFPVAGPVFSRKFKSFAPRFTVDWQAADSLFVYASAAKGVRSGGFNTANAVSATGILASEVAYDEETNWTYEGGIKSRWFDNRLTFNAAVFHTDWKNAQVSGFTDNPTAVNPVRIVRNIGNIKATGFEVQSDLQFNDIFGIGGSLTYSDPKFQAGVYDGGTIAQCVIGTGTTATAAPGCPPVTVITTASGAIRAVPSLEGLRPQRSVKTQWNLHATASVPMENGWTATGRVDVNYTGSAFSNLINTISFGKRTLTNIRLGVDNGHFNVALWANNLFNTTYTQNSINQPRAGIPFAFVIPEVYLGEGRRMGITAGYKF